MTLFDMICI